MTSKDTSFGRRLWFAPHLLDFYLLKLMLRPMLIALVVTMAVLLIERMLRLYELIVDQGAALLPVLTIALSLTPHYLGLALPAAFCIGLMSTLGALSRNNELDALENAGWSLRRIGFSFVIAGVVFALLSLALFGFAQPYARYAYRAAKHSIETAGWSGRVEQSVFVQLDANTVMSAASVDTNGRSLTGVFILIQGDEGDTAITAPRGVVVPDPLNRSVRVLLEDGVSLSSDGPVTFQSLLFEREAKGDGEPFRARASTRELTLNELLARAAAEDAPAAAELRAEFHARVVRSVSLIGIALLAVPLGVVGRRAAGWPRVLVAIAVLVLYHNLLLMAQTLGETGVVDPVLALWGVFIGFMTLTMWLYFTTASQGSQSLPRRVLRRIEDLRFAKSANAP